MKGERVVPIEFNPIVEKFMVKMKERMPEKDKIEDLRQLNPL
jgi:hypothetical protein